MGHGEERAPMLKSKHHGSAWNEMVTVHLVDAVRTLTPFYDYSFVRSSLLHARHRFV